MSKQENLETRQIVRMLICLALLTAGSMLFLPRLIRMGLQSVGFGQEEKEMLSTPPSPKAVAFVENEGEATLFVPSPSPNPI